MNDNHMLVETQVSRRVAGTVKGSKKIPCDQPNCDGQMILQGQFATGRKKIKGKDFKLGTPILISMKMCMKCGYDKYTHDRKEQQLLAEETRR